MNATLPEPLQNVVDHLSMPTLPTIEHLPSLDDIRERLPERFQPEQHRSKKPLLLGAVLLAVIVALVLMRKRGVSDDNGQQGAGDIVTRDAAFVDAR
jgi:hypothetical protein